MRKTGVPSPGFVRRIGEVVDQRRGVDFQVLRSRTLLNRLTGSAMPFGWTVNPFRGSEFEERIYVKRADAAQLVADLRRARDSGQEVAIGAATDPYQPAESRFGITRSVLAAVARVPSLRIGITTKSAAISRDVDVLREIAHTSDLQINVSLISLDRDLLRIIEPRAPRPDLRLRAMQAMADAGVPTRLFVMPVLPLITD